MQFSEWWRMQGNGMHGMRRFTIQSMEPSERAPSRKKKLFHGRDFSNGAAQRLHYMMPSRLDLVEKPPVEEFVCRSGTVASSMDLDSILVPNNPCSATLTAPA
jgi:hypothetical protein